MSTRFAVMSMRLRVSVLLKDCRGRKWEQIPLSDEQRRKMGYLCMTKGGKAGVAYVKHIERERNASAVCI